MCKKSLGYFAVFLSLFIQSGSALGFDHTHAEWTKILKKSVLVKDTENLVDYASVRKDPSGVLKYLRALERVSSAEFLKFTKNEQVAFLINAYNALTIKLVISHYPITTLLEVRQGPVGAWDIPFFNILNRIQTLNALEKEIMKISDRDPRIHMALVCATLSCPKLHATAFLAITLGQQLDRAVEDFVNNWKLNYFDREKKRLYLSSIFKWYENDFKGKVSSLPSFMNRYYKSDNKNSQDLSQASPENIFLPYDWRLNDTSQRVLNPRGFPNRATTSTSPGSTTESDPRSWGNFSPEFPPQFVGSTTEALQTVYQLRPGEQSANDPRISFTNYQKEVPDAPIGVYRENTGSGTERPVGSGTEDGSTTEAATAK